MNKAKVILCLLLVLAAACVSAAGAGADSAYTERDELLRREGDAIIVAEGVTTVGYNYDGTDSGESDLGGIAPNEEFGGGVRKIVFPSTLRYIGEEALINASLDELVLPDTLTYVSNDAMYGCNIGRIVMGKGYTAGVIGGFYTTIGEWQVEEGNPLYSSKDGVLFSADGKVLLSYPCGKKDTHYDVPAGTEEIADLAFSDSMVSLPLQTISLPIGLKKIGAAAFSGCGRLHSMTVPLTVTELDPTAFAECVSLERLSLPPGLTAKKTGGVEWEAFTEYSGDNGVTLKEPRSTDWDTNEREWNHSVYFTGWISGENGDGMVNWYASPEAETPSGQLSAGTWINVSSMSRGRVNAGYADDPKWVDMEDVKPESRDVFFTVSGIAPTGEGRRALAEIGMENYTNSWFDEAEMCGWFSVPAETEDGWFATRDEALPLDQVIVFRRNNGDDRELAMLVSAAQEEPVRIYDAPGGNAVAWTYRSDQAEVLEHAEGWMRVRTASAEGWVRDENIMIVEQESK